VTDLLSTVPVLYDPDSDPTPAPALACPPAGARGPILPTRGASLHWTPEQWDAAYTWLGEALPVLHTAFIAVQRAWGRTGEIRDLDTDLADATVNPMRDLDALTAERAYWLPHAIADCVAADEALTALAAVLR
jgi:hypothetical protein